MDCTAFCRLASHADVVLSAVTREELNEVLRYLKYFCGNGARVCDSFGRNAVHVAASCGKKDVLKWLLEQDKIEGQHGIVGEKDRESGWTALHRSCFYGFLSCALLLLQFGANIYEKDIEGISPVELLMLDSPRKTYLRESFNYRRKRQLDKKGTCVEISSWGRNTNFTLGHGDEKERYIPEVIDIFTRNIKISIQDVVICKFHSVILAENGSVWTCGHGQGGRLGHGHEKTILVPKKVDGLVNQTCIAIAAGQDHSVVLCENGNVFTFGLNNYHQMGHQPPSSQYLSPKQIQVKHLKDKKFIGIAAGKYHTILYTRKEVYSCGLNSGQLGATATTAVKTSCHSKGDRTQILPRQVSALHLKDMSVSLVTCNDAAMACVTDTGDVYLIYQYTQRKIISKFSNISKLLVTGGRLDESHFKEGTERKYSQVIIYGLYEDGKVFQWRQNDKCIRECHWSLRKALSVTDIACGKKLYIVTAQGEVYYEEGLSSLTKKPTKIQPHNLNFLSYSHTLKEEEIIEVSLTRVPHLHRALRIVCDEYSQNFAVLQADPSIGCIITTKITPPEMKEHLSVLFEDAELEDSVHDVEIDVKGRTFAAHRLILAEGGDKFRSLIDKATAKLVDAVDQGGVPVVSLVDEDFEVIRETLEFLYTGSCASLRPLEEGRSVTGFVEEDENEMPHLEEMMLDELAWSFEDVDFEVLDNFQVPLSSEFDGLRDEKDPIFFAREERPSNAKRQLKQKIEDRVPVRLTRRKELLYVAKKYRITELVSRLQDVNNERKTFPQKRFIRNRFSEYHDVVIEAQDGIEYACHKCILVARLEYFYNMLTAGWMESLGGVVRLKMPIISSVLKVILDFLYTDEATGVKESQDLEFLGKILAVADQLWIIRLKEICEAKMASLISLKNAVEMLEFSSLYNAEQLRNVCFEFICLNMSCLFEAGSLEFLSENVLDELSKAYREMIPAMAWRVLTPSDVHLSVPCPQPVSPTKRKGSRSQRRSRTSECDADVRPMQEDGQGAESEDAKEKVLDERGFSLHELRENGIINTRSLPDEAPSKDEEENSDEHVGSCDHKDSNRKTKPVRPMLVPSTGKTRAESNPLPIARRKNGEKQERDPWASQSLSPQSSDLRTIMEHEKTRSVEEEDSSFKERKKEGKSPLGGKSRISQKERKKLRKSFEQLLSLDPKTNEETKDHEANKTSPSPVNPWKSCLNGRPSLSFRELLEEEETREITVEEKIPVTPKKFTKNPRELNSGTDHKGTFLSAWQIGNLACSPPNNLIKFNKIQELQEQETVNRERSMKKPLALIQIEDKAIEELLEHYGGNYNACELIVVEREKRQERSPNWVT